MSNNWQYTHGGKELGPVSPVELKRLAASGELLPDDKVWREGMEKWVPARIVKGLEFPKEPRGKAPQMPPIPPIPKVVSKDEKRLRKPAEKQQAAKEPDPPAGGIDRVGSYIFGSLLLLFFVGVFVWAPEKLPEFKQRMLAVSSALLAGIFAAFMTGGLGVKITGMTSPLGKVGLRAGGGMGVFALVMAWWLSPLAPVGIDKKLDDIHADIKKSGEAATKRHGAVEVKLDQIAVSIQEKIGKENLGPEYDKVNKHRSYQDEYLKKGGLLDSLIAEYAYKAEKNPSNAMYRYLLARIYEQKGKNEEAIQQARAGAKADPAFIWNKRFLLYGIADDSVTLDDRLKLETEYLSLTTEERRMLSSGDPASMVAAIRGVRRRFDSNPVIRDDLKADNRLCWHFFQGLSSQVLSENKAFKSLAGKEAISEKKSVKLRVLEVKTGPEALPLIPTVKQVTVVVLGGDGKDRKEGDRIGWTPGGMMDTAMRYPPIAIRVGLESGDGRTGVWISKRRFVLVGHADEPPSGFRGELYSDRGYQELCAKVNMDAKAGKMAMVDQDGVDSDKEFLRNGDTAWLVFFAAPGRWSANKEAAIDFSFSVERVGGASAKISDSVLLRSK